MELLGPKILKYARAKIIYKMFKQATVTSMILLVYISVCMYKANKGVVVVGIRWINGDIIGFTYKMKNIQEETDTT